MRVETPNWRGHWTKRQYQSLELSHLFLFLYLRRKLGSLLGTLGTSNTLSSAVMTNLTSALTSSSALFLQVARCMVNEYFPAIFVRRTTLSDIGRPCLWTRQIMTGCLRCRMDASQSEKGLLSSGSFYPPLKNRSLLPRQTKTSKTSAAWLQDRRLK